MKKKKWLALGMMLVLVVCAACNDSETSEAAVIGSGEMNVVEKSVYSQLTGAPAVAIEYAYMEEDKVVEEVVTQEITIYYGNERADGLETKTLEGKALTAEVLISALARHNIVPIGTKVLAFECVEEQGKTVLKLDLSKSFGEYLETMGQSGEEVVLAALTDTFLDNYQAQGLWLTVEGEVLETTYDSYEKELTFKEVDFITGTMME